MLENQTKKKIILIGYSGHALVVADIAKQCSYDIAGYMDKKEVIHNPLQIPYLGFEQNISKNEIPETTFFFVAVGDNNKRKDLILFLQKNRWNTVSLCHPRSNIADSVLIDEATVIMAGVSINPFAKIGKGVILNTQAVVEHECIIGDYSHIAPGAVLAGSVTVGHNSFIGANAVIKQGIKIGANVIIGAGSVVVKDIGDGVIVKGNPAK